MAALAGNRVLLQDGVPMAIYAGGEVQFLSRAAASRAMAAAQCAAAPLGSPEVDGGGLEIGGLKVGRDFGERMKQSRQ